MKTKTEYNIPKGSLVAFFVLILLILAAEFFFVSTTSTRIVTVASTTFTDTKVITTVSFSTVTTETTFTTSIIQISTITYIGPTNITVSGTAKSNGIGTSATQIVFTDAQSKKDFVAQITNGKFSIVLPNDHYYNVFIKYTTAAGGVGSGQCTASALVLFSPGGPINTEWSC